MGIQHVLCVYTIYTYPRHVFLIFKSASSPSAAGLDYKTLALFCRSSRFLFFFTTAANTMTQRADGVARVHNFKESRSVPGIQPYQRWWWWWWLCLVEMMRRLLDQLKGTSVPFFYTRPLATNEKQKDRGGARHPLSPCDGAGAAATTIPTATTTTANNNNDNDNNRPQTEPIKTTLGPNGVLYVSKGGSFVRSSSSSSSSSSPPPSFLFSSYSVANNRKRGSHESEK